MVTTHAKYRRCLGLQIPRHYICTHQTMTHHEIGTPKIEQARERVIKLIDGSTHGQQEQMFNENST